MTISATFTGLVLAKISILPKISRFCLFALHRPINVWHTREWQRSDGSLCFRIALTVLWCHTTIGLHSVASSQMGEWTPLICTYICIALTARSRSMIGRLCTMLARYWSNLFLIITSGKYENRKTKPKPGYFRQYRNPGQDISRKNGTFGQPSEARSSRIWKLRPTLNAAQCSSVLLQR